VVASADQARRKIERDLHDGAQQRFVSLLLQLRAVRASVPPDQAQLADALDRVLAELSDALDDLREFSRGIHPAILADAGLGPALRALSRRCPLPVRLDVQIQGRLPERVEVTAYYTISEALTNAVKHANATVVRIDVDATSNAVRLAVRDDGTGGADPARGSGLLGIRDRVEAVGGTITIHSPIGKGTELLAEFPLRPAG
jgi:signal transduction histidine kinase